MADCYGCPYRWHDEDCEYCSAKGDEIIDGKSYKKENCSYYKEYLASKSASNSSYSSSSSSSGSGIDPKKEENAGLVSIAKTLQRKPTILRVTIIENAPKAEKNMLPPVSFIAVIIFGMAKLPQTVRHQVLIAVLQARLILREVAVAV